MTPEEIAQHTASWVEFIPNWIAALAATSGVIVAFVQLSSIKNQLEIAVKNQKSDSLKIVLEIETQMNSRKLEWDKASKQVREADASEQNVEIWDDFFQSVKESYFNSLDRLCYCIEKEYIADKDWRAEYRNLLHDTIVANPDDFNAASSYKNMIALNTKWQSS